jgi:CRP-like cAMP-binding protein
VIQRGERATFFAILLKGNIEVVLGNFGAKEEQRHVVYRGETFGELALFTNRPYRTATCLSGMNGTLVAICPFSKLMQGKSEPGGTASGDGNLSLKLVKMLAETTFAKLDRIMAGMQNTPESFMPNPATKEQVQALWKSKGLLECEAFDDFNDEEIALLASHFFLASFSNNAVVFEQGQIANYLGLLLEGELVVLNEFGKEIARRNVCGEWVGEMAFLNNGRRTTKLVAGERALLALISKDELSDMSSRHGQLAVKLVRSIGRSGCVRVQRRMEELQAKQNEEKRAALGAPPESISGSPLKEDAPTHDGGPGNEVIAPVGGSLTPSGRPRARASSICVIDGSHDDDDDEVLIQMHAQRVVARAAAVKLQQLVQRPDDEEGVSSEAVKRLKREMKEALNLLRTERELNARLEQSVDSLRKQLAKATPAKFRMMEREFETTKKQLALSRRLEALAKEHAAEQKDLVALQALKVLAVEGQIKGLRLAEEHATAAASRLPSRATKQRQEEEAQRRAMEEVSLGVQAMAMSIKDERDTLAERNRELENRVKYLESELVSLRDSLNGERSVAREATAKQIEQELQLATSIAELTKCGLEKKTVETSLEQARQQFRSCEVLLANSEAARESLSRNMNTLNAEVKSTGERTAMLSAKLARRDAQRSWLLMSRWRAILRLLQAKRWFFMMLHMASDMRGNAIQFAQQRAGLYAVAEQKWADERKVLMEMRMLQEEDNALMRGQCEQVKHDRSLIEQELAMCKLQLRQEVEWAISLKTALISLFDQLASAQLVFREIDVNLFKVLGQVRSHVDVPMKYVLEHPCQPADLELLHQGIAVFRTRVLSDELVASAHTRIDELLGSEPSLPVDVAAEISTSLAAVSFEQLRGTLSRHQRSPSNRPNLTGGVVEPSISPAKANPMQTASALRDLHEIPQGWSESCRPSSASLPAFPMRPSSVSSVRSRPQSPPNAAVGTTDGTRLEHAASATSPALNVGKPRKHQEHAESAQVIPDATAVSSPVMLQITQALLSCLASHRVALRWPELVETIRQALHISGHAASTLARKALNKQRPTTATDERPARPQSAYSLRAMSPADHSELPAKTVVARVPHVSNDEPSALVVSPVARGDPKSPLQRALLHSFDESCAAPSLVEEAAEESLRCLAQSLPPKKVVRRARKELSEERSLEDSYRIFDRLCSSGPSPLTRTK